MPEQPSDPRNYDMRIPPPHDLEKQRDLDKPASDETENRGTPAEDNSVVRGEEESRSDRR